MCDTLVALGNATADGSVIFGKNSDREPNEAHQVILLPAKTYGDHEYVQCTYIRIPQVKSTYAVLLAKPFWIWGAEMGANEKDVVIGNEAVFTRVPYDKKPGLIGMDFIRLALERSSTAKAALDTITQLLEQYGQGGNCGFQHTLYYHNSFIIADPNEAWVLETAGKHWAAEKVKDVRSISNSLSIESEWDLSSGDLEEFAQEMGWIRKGDRFNFRNCYTSDWYSRLVTRFISSRERQACSQGHLRKHIGKITPLMVMNILRKHAPAGDNRFPKLHGLTGSDICAHASMGPVRGSQTTGSMVSHLQKTRSTHWLTATSAPCTGIFKPVWFDSGLPELGPAPTGEFTPDSLWWQHELLHRQVMQAYESRIKIIQKQQEEMEQSFFENSIIMLAKSVEERRNFTLACFEESRKTSEEWMEKILAIPADEKIPLLYRWAWKRYNREAKLEIN